MGIVERGGKVHAEAIPAPGKAILVGKVHEYVADDGKTVVTDDASTYRNLDLPHGVVRHSALEYVRGEAACSIRPA